MTQEQFEKCLPYEQVFRWAINSNFIHMTNGEFSSIEAIYAEVFGQHLTNAQKNCNTCRLQALKRLGTEMDNYKAEQEKNKKEEDSKPKKKAGRPRKIDLEKE